MLIMRCLTLEHGQVRGPACRKCDSLPEMNNLGVGTLSLSQINLFRPIQPV